MCVCVCVSVCLSLILSVNLSLYLNVLLKSNSVTEIVFFYLFLDCLRYVGVVWKYLGIF